jgi:CHASE3 domain sensor protein
MAMPIFWRLICGYVVILLISLSISSYSIVQLGELSSSAHSALNRDNRMIGYQEKLTDVFLSEVRYAGKFIITHSQPLHDQLRQFKGDFVRYMDEVKTLAESPDIKARLDRVEEFHVRYHELFDQEVKYIKARQPYAETRYREEKEKVLEKLLGELGNLKAHLQNQLQTKLGSIASAAQTARRIAIATTIALLGFGVALAFVISRSIVTPLSELRRTTENIEGDLDYGAKFSRLPEIHDVAVALHNARQRLQEAARTNASFVHSLTDRFATPLVSINTRLSYLKDELSPIMSDRFSRLPEVPKVALTVTNQERPNVYEPRAAARRTFAPIARFVRRAQSKIIAVVTRARELSIGSWNIVRDCIAAGIWKGEKR